MIVFKWMLQESDVKIDLYTEVRRVEVTVLARPTLRKTLQ
jgi:hypothetical protein